MLIVIFFGRLGAPVGIALLTLVAVTGGSQSQACERGKTPFVDRGSDCPSYIEGGACVAEEGDIAYRVRGEQWRLLPDNATLDRQPRDFFYIVNRKGFDEARAEALFVNVVENRSNDSLRIDNVKLSVNKNFAAPDGYVGESKKDRYNDQHLNDRSLYYPLHQWHRYMRMDGFRSDKPEERRGMMALSDQDKGANDRFPHARLYSFKTNRIACIPFEIRPKPDTTSISIIVRELINQHEGHAVSRNIVLD
ncbi:MAG TPA: hypothetical protein VIN77_12425 [Aurantimonas sp.]